MMSFVESDAVPVDPMAFRQLLKTLDDGLGSEDCHKMIFLAADVGIPKSKLERMQQATDIFEELEKQMLISAGDVSRLWELMELIHRKDLLKKIESYCSKQRAKGNNGDYSTFSKYRLLLLEIADNTSKSEMESFKHVCKDYLGRQAVSKLKNVYQLFSLLEERGRLAPTNMDFLLELLTFAGNMQMAQKVHNFKNQTGPTDAELVNLSSKLGSEWRKLGTYLGLQHNTLQAINRDCRSIEDKTMEMLFTWRHSVSCSVEDAYRNLSKALKLCHRMDLAEEVEATCKKRQPAPTPSAPIQVKQELSQPAGHYPFQPAPTPSAPIQVKQELFQPAGHYTYPAGQRVLMKPSDFQTSGSSLIHSGIQEMGSWPQAIGNHGLPDQILQELSEYIPADWRKLSTFLGIDSATVRRIDQDHHDSVEKAYQMLIMWRQRLPANADGIKTLAGALKVVGRVDLSERLKGVTSLPVPMVDQLQLLGKEQPAAQGVMMSGVGRICEPQLHHWTPDPRQPVSVTDTVPTGNQDPSGVENLTVKTEAMEIEMSQATQEVPETKKSKSDSWRGGNGSDPSHMRFQQESSPEYRMNRNPRGLCMIINNAKFAKNKRFKDRHGSEVDAGKLNNLFNKLHFEVALRENLAADEMYSWFKEISQVDHSDYDCFACCIMSHGALGVVYGSDCQPIEIQEILGLFKAISCRSLNGKPKLFFIQACQGNTPQEGVDIETDDASPGMGSGMAKTLPKESDIFLSYATVPGYVSYRNKKEGSWYVSALVDEMTKHHNQYELLKIMTRVNHRMSEATAVVKEGNMKQVPMQSCTLRKDLYLPSFES